MQQAVALMADGGSIILTGIGCRSKGFEADTVYSATKAAIRSSHEPGLRSEKTHIRATFSAPGRSRRRDLSVGNWRREGSREVAGPLGASDPQRGLLRRRCYSLQRIPACWLGSNCSSMGGRRRFESMPSPHRAPVRRSGGRRPASWPRRRRRQLTAATACSARGEAPPAGF